MTDDYAKALLNQKNCPICLKRYTYAIDDITILISGILYHYDCFVEREKPKLKKCSKCGKEVNFEDRYFDSMKKRETYYCIPCLWKKNQKTVDKCNWYGEKE